MTLMQGPAARYDTVEVENRHSSLRASVACVNRHDKNINDHKRQFEDKMRRTPIV